MMNGTAVLPAVVTTFAGNAATISAGSVQNGSAIGTAGGFSDTLGAMVTSGQQCNMNSAVRMNADNKAVMNGEILSGLNELEQNAQELKELLKTAELAGYLQGGTMQFYADVMQTDNSELMQIMSGLEVSSPIGDVLSEEGAFSGISDGNDVNTALGLQNGEISAVNDFASEIQMNNDDSADTVKQTNVKAETAAATALPVKMLWLQRLTSQTLLQAWLSEMPKSLQMRIIYVQRQIRLLPKRLILSIRWALSEKQAGRKHPV